MNIIAAKRRITRKRNQTFLRLLCLFAALEFLSLLSSALRQFTDRLNR